MNTEAKLSVTCGVMLSLEEYNELRQAEPYRRLHKDGYCEIEIVCWEEHIRLTVQGGTSVSQVIDGAMALFGKDWASRYLRTGDGVLLEPARTLDEIGIKFGERLFLSW